MSKRFLFLSNGSVCYDSTTYFIECISSELIELGWEVRHVRLDKSRQVEDLRALVCECSDNPYDYVMDINTKLDAIKDDNGIYCIERIGRQFWHYILDHPFYHHDALKQKLGNMHVICLAPCVDGRCKAPIEDIQNAVDGAISDEQTIKLRQCLNHIDELENHKKEIEREIFRLSDKYDTALNLIRTVPGFDKNPMTAIQVLSESGGDMSVFPTAKNLVSWAGCETVSSFV